MKPILEPSEHTFSTLAGHDVTKRYLINAVDGGVLPHAILMTGPTGIGRTSLAYALAKYVNCPHGAPAECPCNVCRKLRTGVAPDFLLIEPRSASGQITLAGWKPGRDDPDNLQYYRFVDSPPLEFKKKVLVFRQAERMNISLSNYLLKLIEEPPSYLLIVFLAPRITDVIPTIRSRCTPIVLSPLDYECMLAVSQILAPDLEPNTRHLLVTLSEGRPGKFLRLLEEDAHAEHAAIAMEMNFFREHGFLALFATAQRLAHRPGEGDAVERLGHSLAAAFAWLRDAILHAVMEPNSAKDIMIYRDVAADVKQFADKTDIEALVAAARNVAAFDDFIPRQTDRTYILELLLMRLGRTLRNR
ncbi:MAG: hypothetical protein N2Z21_06495 [Candidatus Sumerlaeaceae bacterium]|nr:hypothetical protein [Candidatus Sumerlaeaceae bacterium]